MQPRSNPSFHRPLRAAACLALAAGIAPTAHAQTNRFINNGGQWSNAANWSLGVVPQSTHNVLIDPFGPNSGTVFYFPTGGPEFNNVTVAAGMTLDLDARYIQPEKIFNHGTILARAVNSGFTTLAISGDFENHGLLRLFSGSGVQLVGANQPVLNLGTIAGVGGLSFNSGPPSQNSGTIRADGNGELAIGARALFAPNVYDLDGDGTGRVEITTAQSRFSLAALGLADPFSGVIEIKPGGVLDMELINPWTMDASGSVVIEPADGVGQWARIEGSPWTVAGLVELQNGPSRLRIMADTTVNAAATFDVGTDAQIRFEGNVTITGGLFTVSLGGSIYLYDPVTITGGFFETPSTAIGDGVVSFVGPTNWGGEVTIDGIARQTGNATVGPNPAAIFARAFDMDGAWGNTWTINASLRIEADQIDHLGLNTVDSDITVAGPSISQLTIELTDPADFWSAARRLDLIGSAQLAFPVNRLAGSPVVILDELGVTHRVRVTADMSLAPTALVDFASPAALVQTTGRTEVFPGAAFQGGGVFNNGSQGHMTLHDGVVINGAQLRNAGRLDLGPAPGLVAVDAFENSASGDLQIKIGGFAPGSDHDLLTVSAGAATLAGKLSIELADVGVGLFVPQTGDEFTILTALNGVSGSFANTPTTVAGGLEYTWSVIYQPNAVVVRLESVAPAVCDADINADGLLNFFDMAAFVALYNARDPAADLAGPFGTWNFFDLAAYVNIYTAGCP